MKRYPVRCCCRPDKVFGTLALNVPDRPGRYVIRRPRHLPVLSWFNLREKPIASSYIDLEPVEVELRHLTDPITGIYTLAVYSDDRPIEFWRGVPGFVEVAA